MPAVGQRRAEAPPAPAGAARGCVRLRRLPPLDRAADRVDLLARRRLPGEQRVERRGELAARDLRRLPPVVVDAAVIGEPARPVEDVDVRRAHRAEGARHLLRLVEQVGEAVALLAPAAEQVLGPILGVVGRIVRADADQLRAAWRVLALEREDAVRGARADPLPEGGRLGLHMDVRGIARLADLVRGEADALPFFGFRLLAEPPACWLEVTGTGRAAEIARTVFGELGA